MSYKRKAPSYFKSNVSTKIRPNPVVTKAAIAKIVTKAINRSRETKMTTSYSNEVAGTTLTAPGVYFMTFNQPAVGAANWQRVGNQIQPVKTSLRIAFWNSSVNTIYMRMLVLKVHDGQMTNNEVAATLFESFAGTDVAGTGITSDLVRVVNRESFTVLKDEVIVLGYESAGYSSPNSAAIVKSYYVKQSGTLVYPDGSTQAPINDRILALIVPMEADGDENIGSSFKFSYAQSMYYKDN